MTVIEFILGISLILIIVTGWCVGIWHVTHVIRRRHRLEREADEREHRKQLAADFAEIAKQVGGAGEFSFSDYVQEPEKKSLSE